MRQKIYTVSMAEWDKSEGGNLTHSVKSYGSKEDANKAFKNSVKRACLELYSDDEYKEEEFEDYFFGVRQEGTENEYRVIVELEEDYIEL